MHKDHGFALDDIKNVFHKTRPQGLHVFGQYSYDDVCVNGWGSRVPDWNTRKQRNQAFVPANIQEIPSSIISPTQAHVTDFNRRLDAGTDVFLPQITRTIEDEIASSGDGLVYDTTTLSFRSPATQMITGPFQDPIIGIMPLDEALDVTNFTYSLESSTIDADYAGIGTHASQPLDMSVDSMNSYCSKTETTYPTNLCEQFVMKKRPRRKPTPIALPLPRDQISSHRRTRSGG